MISATYDNQSKAIKNVITLHDLTSIDMILEGSTVCDTCVWRLHRLRRAPHSGFSMA